MLKKGWNAKCTVKLKRVQKTTNGQPKTKSEQHVITKKKQSSLMSGLQQIKIVEIPLVRVIKTVVVTNHNYLQALVSTAQTHQFKHREALSRCFCILRTFKV